MRYLIGLQLLRDCCKKKGWSDEQIGLASLFGWYGFWSGWLDEIIIVSNERDIKIVGSELWSCNDTKNV